MLKKEEDASVLKDEERTPCEVWTRVMGYHRTTTSFNIGKKGEYEERTFFKESACDKECNDGKETGSDG